MDDEAAHEFYKDPEYLRPAGPWVHRRARPGIRDLRYEPPSCGPRTQTENLGSLPFWGRNPEG